MNVTAPAVGMPSVVLAMLLSASPAPLDAARQALEVAEGRLAAAIEEAGPVAAFSAFFGDASILLEPDRDIVRGKEAVLAAVSETAARSPLRTKLHRVGAGASSDGTLGYTFGWLEPADDPAPVARPKYLALWRSEEGGWRVVALARSAGDAPPSPAPAGAGAVVWHRRSAFPGDSAKLAADIAGTDQAFAAFASREGVCAAFIGFADQDAVVFRRTDFGWGREAVRSAYAGCTPRDRATWAPVWSVSAASGDLGASVGEAVFAAREGDGSDLPSTYSKYLTIWARQADGTWKWLLDAGSVRPSPITGGLR